MKWWFVACLVLSALVAGCVERRTPDRLVAKAELGLFFGGQIQERDEIPFVLDRAKQTQGFRVEFSHVLAKPAHVRWEIDRPNPKQRGRAVTLAQADVRAGLDRFDQEIAFQPGDPLGVWNVRVIVDDQVVIDRPVSVYDVAARKRAIKEAEALAKPAPLPRKR
jgi:hypothetical protein